MKNLKAVPDRINCENGIYLTVIRHRDAESLVKYLNHPEIHETTGSIPYPYSITDANQFITSVIQFEKENGMQRDWAIRTPEGEQIGSIGFLFNHGTKAHRSEIGYWLGKPYWNQGIGSNVVKVWSDHMLATRHFIRLEALVFDANIASCKVLEHAGFEKEGFLKKACKKGDTYKDVHLYAKLKP